jgi:hypothetical protein
VQGGHLFVDVETWFSSSAMSGHASGLAGTDVSLRPGYGFRLGDAYLVGRAYAVVSTIWSGTRAARGRVEAALADVPLAGDPRLFSREPVVGWSDPALALSAPALLRHDASPVTGTPTIGFTIPASPVSPVTRAFGEFRVAVDLPSTRWAGWVEAERIFHGGPRPALLDGFQREFSCTTPNLDCLFQRPARESWSTRVTALVELRVASAVSVGARMTADRVALKSIPEPGGGVAGSEFRDALTFTVHAIVRIADPVGLVVTATENGRPLSPGHPLRLPFTEASESFVSLGLWVRTDPALQPFLVDPFGG